MNNLSVYKAFEHQHLTEIGQSLNQLQKDFNDDINFIPQRGSFTRGIFASVYTDCKMSIEEIQNLYEDFYSNRKKTYRDISLGSAFGRAVFSSCYLLIAPLHAASLRYPSRRADSESGPCAVG